jgi:hypothetical protein
MLLYGFESHLKTSTGRDKPERQSHLDYTLGLDIPSVQDL